MSVRVITGDCKDVLKTLPDESVHCVVTSPPYWGLRDYGVAGQLGLEATPAEYVERMVGVFREVRRVLRDDGTLWLNLGDSYAQNEVRHRNGQESFGMKCGAWEAATAQTGRRLSHGLKSKDLVGIPWMVAFALRADGWYLRQEIIWSKPNPMPESVRDRCTKAHESIFLLAKAERYYFDADAIAEPAASFGRPQPEPADKTISPNNTAWLDNRYAPGASGFGHGDDGLRNKRSVWTVATQPFKEAHFATFPPALIEPCILAGCPACGVVLDPFGGAGTTGLVAESHNRNAILIELNPTYAEMARNRIRDASPLFAEVA